MQYDMCFPGSCRTPSVLVGFTDSVRGAVSSALQERYARSFTGVWPSAAADKWWSEVFVIAWRRLDRGAGLTSCLGCWGSPVACWPTSAEEMLDDWRCAIGSDG